MKKFGNEILEQINCLCLSGEHLLLPGVSDAHLLREKVDGEEDSIQYSSALDSLEHWTLSLFRIHVSKDPPGDDGCDKAVWSVSRVL